MPYATNPDDGVRVYYEVEGEGLPLALGHGGTQSGRIWREFGYVAALSDHYQLILIDLRGHGKSDTPETPAAYMARRLAGDVIAVLDELEIDHAHYWGYSYGAWIGYRLGAYYPQRVRSLILGTLHPYRLRLTEEERLHWDETTPQYFDMLEREQGVDVAQHRAILEAMNVDAGIADALPQMSIPTLIYAGELDPTATGAKRAACAIAGASFLSTGQMRHGEDMADSSRILPVARAFLDRVGADDMG